MNPQSIALPVKLPQLQFYNASTLNNMIIKILPDSSFAVAGLQKYAKGLLINGAT